LQSTQLLAGKIAAKLEHEAWNPCHEQLLNPHCASLAVSTAILTSTGFSERVGVAITTFLAVGTELVHYPGHHNEWNRCTCWTSHDVGMVYKLRG